MYSTDLYLYQQRTRVVVLDSSGQLQTVRYHNVYAKKLTLNLGVDNVLLFSIINQDEKPVNVTGSTFVFRVTDTQGTTLLLQVPMVILNAATGQIKVTVPAADTLGLLAQSASYSISVQSGNLNQAVFTNAQSSGRAPIDLVNSVFPQFTASHPLTIPSMQLSSQQSYDGANWQHFPGWSQYGYWSQGNGDGQWYYNSRMNTEYYSSHITPTNYITTVQMDLVGYSGTIKAQWADTYQSFWYNVTESEIYLNKTGTVHLNIIGWHPLLRLVFNNSIFATPKPPGIPANAYAICENGAISEIVMLNGGNGYLAPPKIDIIGNGSGAKAEAVINEEGVVTAINVTDGGNGYWPIPVGGANPEAYPVPPTSQGGYVVITTGTVTNLMYR